MFETAQDPTLIVLMIAAGVSIGFSFYHPGGAYTSFEVIHNPRGLKNAFLGPNPPVVDFFNT